MTRTKGSKQQPTKEALSEISHAAKPHYRLHVPLRSPARNQVVKQGYSKMKHSREIYFHAQHDSYLNNHTGATNDLPSLSF